MVLGENILIDTRGEEHEFDHFLEVSDAMDWISFSVHACRLDFFVQLHEFDIQRFRMRESTAL